MYTKYDSKNIHPRRTEIDMFINTQTVPETKAIKRYQIITLYIESTPFNTLPLAKKREKTNKTRHYLSRNKSLVSGCFGT